jgi:hypothetical protein
MDNPFSVYSPEKMEAEKAEQLFVELHSSIPYIQTPDPAMILGARGSGKTMLIRCLLPDVLRIRNKCKLSELEFIAFHIPIKTTQSNITDLHCLDKHHASYIINEHFLSLNILMNVLHTLSKLEYDFVFNVEQYTKFFNDIYLRYLRLAGCKKECLFNNTSANNFFLELYHHAEEMYSDFMSYVLNISDLFGNSIPPYNLPYLTYLRFLVPVISGLKEIEDFPNKCIYLFIDDADNLSLTQTKILNSWIASRTQPDICLKVSAQYAKYKTFISTTGSLVEAPHDYTEINISEIYTTKKDFYAKTVKEILKRRLKIAGINVDPKDYFPVNDKQEQAIENIKQEILKNWEAEGRGNRPNDDVLRYARPNYIRDLGGKKKSRSTYSYAGIETITHLSSGIIRYVLDVAALMYDLTIKQKGAEKAKKSIPYNIQDEIVRKKAESMLLSQFRNLETISSEKDSEFTIASKLQNLLISMGKTFYDILMSQTKSERRVFSIALSNIPTKEIREVLDFGVQTGFFHLSTIGTKEGDGRTWLYIMNRGLAPFFKLDPSGFAGYLFVTNETLEQAIYKGKKLREDNDNDMEIGQFTLF